jgi:hypothetical protein
MRFSALVYAFALVVFLGCSNKKEGAPAAKQADKAVAAATDKAADKPAEPTAEKPGGGCAYITEAEASEALGQPSRYRSNDGSDNCVIDPVGEPSATTHTVDFTVTVGDTSKYDYLAKDGKPLAGVGDKAVIDGAGGMAQIVIVKGSATLSMTVAGPKAVDAAVIKAFADKVFGHI